MANNFLGLTDNPVDQFFYPRHIVDQTLYLTGGPNASIRVAFVVHVLAALASDKVTQIFDRRAALILNFDDFAAYGILCDPCGIAERLTQKTRRPSLRRFRTSTG